MQFINTWWPPLAQAATVTNDALSTKDVLTVSGFLMGMMALGLVMLKIIGPALAKWYAKAWDIQTKSSEHALDIDKEEDKLSLEAKQYLAQQARESMNSFRSLVQELQVELKELRKENNKYLIELGELRARDEIRSMEIERLRNEVREAQTSSVSAKQSLLDAQSEISQMRLQIDLLQKEVDRLTVQYRVELENNHTLIWNRLNRIFTA